jgi:hypothetical protein
MLAVHAIALATLSGCGIGRPSLDDVAARYVRATLQLAQHDPALVEGWSDAMKPGPRIPVAVILTDINDLSGLIDRPGPAPSSPDDAHRVRYLKAQIQALHFAAERLLGRTAGVDDQLREEFGMAAAPYDPAAIERVRSDIDRAIPGSGGLAGRIAALRARTTIPTARREAVMDVALRLCREPIAPVIELPKDERVTILFREGMEWDAFARDAGGHHTVIDINEGPLDVSRALRLACHEGYAGHHAHHLLRDRAIASRHWPEWQVTPAFGPHLLLSEGAAEVGADLAFASSQRAALYRDHLFPAAGLDPADVDALVRLDDWLPQLLPAVTDVARQYLDSKISEQQALERLANEALIGNAAGTLSFIEKRRARALVYGEGRQAILSMLPSRTLTALRDLFPFRPALQ